MLDVVEMPAAQRMLEAPGKAVSAQGRRDLEAEFPRVRVGAGHVTPRAVIYF
jgi:hypothetical protein